MEATHPKESPGSALRIARHAAGMALVALANPLIYFDSSPFEQWAMLPVGAMLIALALFGVLALLSPDRARSAWPSLPIKAAWLVLALMLLANWQSDKPKQASTATPEVHQPPAAKRTYTYEELTAK